MPRTVTPAESSRNSCPQIFSLGEVRLTMTMLLTSTGHFDLARWTRSPSRSPYKRAPNLFLKVTPRLLIKQWNAGDKRLGEMSKTPHSSPGLFGASGDWH